ncbi:hypothetical protein BDD41_2212 [Paracoccus versutus]|uniref:Uncharacterized protein n=1 Tax=Paracoccus versutus TaxID=34007 RepID=A0A3D9XK71_PARVE|nr:hypothetical protein BDD41_2212 [Paracoccus versutus]
MKKSRFTEAQIMGVLRQAEGGPAFPPAPPRQKAADRGQLYRRSAGEQQRGTGSADHATPAQQAERRRSEGMAGLADGDDQRHDAGHHGPGEPLLRDQRRQRGGIADPQPEERNAEPRPRPPPEGTAAIRPPARHSWHRRPGGGRPRPASSSPPPNARGSRRASRRPSPAPPCPRPAPAPAARTDAPATRSGQRAPASCRRPASRTCRRQRTSGARANRLAALVAGDRPPARRPGFAPCFRACAGTPAPTGSRPRPP